MKVGRGYVFECRGVLYLSMVDKKCAAILRCLSQKTKKICVINSNDITRVLTSEESQKLLKTFF